VAAAAAAAAAAAIGLLPKLVIMVPVEVDDGDDGDDDDGVQITSEKRKFRHQLRREIIYLSAQKKKRNNFLFPTKL
jgi:hypothetical protein